VIGRLRGKLVELQGDAVIVDCGGVGYEVGISGYTLMSLPAVGDEVTLRVYTHAQENKIALFGFASVEERAIFDLLISVSSVGPVSAMGILSGGRDPFEIARLLAGGDVKALTTIKGVGKKTAERLVVELRDRCELLLAGWGARGADRGKATAALAPATPRSGFRSPILDEVAAALVQLGWKAHEVEAAIAQLEAEEGATLEELLRQALRAMPR
jgi:holliday junction DNA helicase RuvA